MSARILVLPGTLASASPNRRLAAEAARLLALSNATVTFLNLADYPLPLLDAEAQGDEDVPGNAVLLAQRMAEQDGLLVVSPECNASVAPLLKNAVDWTSRVRKVKGRPVQPFRKLVVGLASASSGRGGGLLGLIALRSVLQSLGAEVLTAQVTLADAAEGFDGDGCLKDEPARMALDALVEQLLEHARVLGRHQL